MLERLYVHNYRCFENFELNLTGLSSALLIGRNGAGKSTVLSVLEVFQKIGRGQNRIGALTERKDFAYHRSNLPMRFELEVRLSDVSYKYSLAFELPEHFKEPRVLDESLHVDGQPIYERKKATVQLSKHPGGIAEFNIDWHLVALPVVQTENEGKGPLNTFKEWLGEMLILSPVPAYIDGQSHDETLKPEKRGENLADWLSGLLLNHPKSYSMIVDYLRQVIPDFSEFRNEPTGKDSRNLFVVFSSENKELTLDFKVLSDGEKCFFLSAMMLAANETYGPLFCFWDEPDNYLSMSEVGHFIAELRRSFARNGGQIIATSHNQESILKFSDEDTLLLDRKSHLEPTRVKTLKEINLKGDLLTALVTGDLRL
jgi:predicted ATPase